MLLIVYRISIYTIIHLGYYIMVKRVHNFLFLLLSTFSLSTPMRSEESYFSKTAMGILTVLVGGAIVALAYKYFNKKTNGAATPQKRQSSSRKSLMDPILKRENCVFF